MKVLITGATGFIGRALTESLAKTGTCHIIAAVRKQDDDLPDNVKRYVYSGILPDTDWREMLQDVDCVIHTAARVHERKDEAKSPLDEFRRINTYGTANLAAQAARSGVKRFVYLSSVKVNGESTRPNAPFKETDTPNPSDAYGISKYEAEQELLKLSSKSEMEVVVIRPPIVYGVGVKGNFLTMIKWIKKGFPLPLRAIHNLRSLVALENLVDFIIVCSDRENNPMAANQVFLISDDDDISTPELLTKLAAAYEVKIRLIFVPLWMMRFVALLFRRTPIIDRLSGSLQVDCSKAKKLLGWKPVISMDKQLRLIAVNQT